MQNSKGLASLSPFSTSLRATPAPEQLVGLAVARMQMNYSSTLPLPNPASILLPFSQPTVLILRPLPSNLLAHNLLIYFPENLISPILYG